MEQLLFHGMHGLGDNLHQRAVIRELMREHEVWLKTPWPQVYHDLDGLHLVRMNSPLPTMSRNEQRSQGLYGPAAPESGVRHMSCGYWDAEVTAAGSVLGAMSSICGVPVGDFRLPVPGEWIERARAFAPTGRPVLVYRPLLERNDCWMASARNPDYGAYSALFWALRHHFYVISIADLTSGTERVVGQAITSDAEYHAGELDLETLVGLFSLADLVFTSPGFAIVLAQAVGTPAICVFGGFEGKASFSAGARFVPWLPIEPITPCPCWSHACQGDKTIDLQAARDRIEAFIGPICVH